jgi:tetratricopeptide (TPR) repeat protein
LQIEEGLFDQAVELSRALIERTKDLYKRVLRELRLGDSLDRSGKRKEAIETYRATLDRVGAESWLEREILAQIERVYRREDDLAGLQKEYETLVKERPRRVGIYRAYVRVLAEAGDAKGAIEKFQNILKLMPGDRESQEAFIELHVQASDYEGGIKHLKTLIEQHPQDGELLVQLSQLQAKANDKAGAGESIEKFLAVSDKSEYAYLRAARLLEQFELAEAAKTKYAALVAAFPDSVAAKESQAAFLYKVGDKEPALAIWRGIANGADAQQLVRLARALASRNEHGVAYELLKERHAEFGGNWLYLGQLVTEATNNKDFAAAVPWALARVESSNSSGDLNESIAQAAIVIERAERVSDVLRDLQAAETKSLRKSCLIAELLELSEDYQQADAALASWIEKGESLAVMQQVRLATRRYDWTAAAGAMRKLIDLPNERKSENVRRLIEFYERDFRLDDALTWVAEWKKLSPGSTSPWLAESRLQQLSGKEDAAVETLRQAVKEFDGNEEIRMQLAQLYGNTGKYADAARIYWLQFEESESLSDKLRYVEQLARLGEQQGNVTQLVENFEERRRSNRQSIEPLLALATIHRVANNYESRRQALAEASKMKPEDLELLHEIARIEEQEGDWERARATLEGALALDKTQRTRQRLARLHIQYGDPDTGFAMLYQLAGGEKSDPRDIESVADAMIGAGDWQGAKDLLATQVEQHPEDFRLRYLLGIAYEEEDEQAAAVEEFLTALQSEKEIPGLKTAGQTGIYPSTYLSQMAEIMPKESIDIIQFQQGRYTAYAYRQQRGMYYATVSTGGRGKRISLPSSIEQVRQMSLMHLFSIAQTLDDEEQKQLLGRVHGAGVANAPLLFAVTPSDIQSQINADELLEKFPENEAIRAVVLMRMSATSGELTADFYRDSFEQFQKSRPQLALLAVMQGAARHEELRDLLSQLGDLLNQLQKPNSVFVMQLCQYLGRLNVGYDDGQASELPESARKLISDKLIEWYPHVRNQQPYGQYIFMYASRALKTSSDAASFIRLLEDEVARSRGGVNQQQQPQAYFGGQPDQFLAMPQFPPASLADFPTSVVQLLSRNQQNDPFGQAVQPTWENSEVVALLPNVKDPVLRVLLAAFVEADDVVEKTLSSMLAEKTPMLDAYLLGATRAASKEKYDEAVRLLEKARYLPMNRTVRRKVDETLLAIALDQTDLLKENAELQQSARDAALRLRHGTLQANERQRLVSALEELGLKKEAELLEKKSSSVAATGTMAPRYVGRSVQPSSQDQIRRLIEQGKRDVAAKMLANESLALIQQAASQPGNWSYSSYQLRQVRERIASYRLTEDVLASLDPKESDNHRKWADFGMVNEALEKPEEAQKCYERALKLRPKEDAYRARLVFLVSKKNPQEAIALCQGFGRNGVVSLIAEILGRMRENDNSIDSRLQLAEFARALFIQQGKVDNSDLSWGPSVCAAVGDRMYGRNGSLPPLYMPKNANDIYGNYEGGSGDAFKRRQVLHDTFCREMLQHATTAEKAFTLLLASCEAREEVSFELFDLAVAALLTLEKKAPGGIAGNQYNVYYSSSGYTVPRRTPAEFIVQQCFAKNDWSTLDEKVVPHLTQIARRDLVDEIESCRTMYTCEPSEFVDKAESYVRAARRRLSPQDRYDGREPEQLVCEAWQARKLDFELQPLVLKMAEQSKREGQSHRAPNYLLRFASQLADKNQADGATQFYEDLAKIYLGPREKRKEYIERNYDRQRIQSNSPNAQIHAFAAILQQGLQDPRLLEPTLQFIGEGMVEGIVQNLQHYAQQGLTKAVNDRGADAVVAHLDKIGLLGAPGMFASRALASTGDGTIFSAVVETFKRSDKNKQEEIKKLLREREPATFGAQMFLAEWDATEDGRFAVLTGLAAEFDKLQQLDEEQAQRLAKLLGSYPTKFGKRDVPENMQPLMKWILDRNADQGRSLGDTILKAKRFEDVKMPGYDPGEWLAGVLPELVRHDPGVAVDAYFKFVSLYEDGMQRSVVSYHFNNVPSELLSRAVRELAETDATRTHLLLGVLNHKKGDTLAFSVDEVHQLTLPVRHKYNTITEDSRKNKTPSSEAMQQFHKWLTEEFKQQTSPALITAFYRTFQHNKHNAEETAEITKWLNESIATNPSDENLKSLLAALMHVAADRAHPKPQKQPDGQPATVERFELAPFHQRYLELLADKESPLPARLVVANFLGKDRTLPVEVAVAINRVAIEACDSKGRLVDDHHQNFAKNAAGLLEDSHSTNHAREFLQAWHKRFGRVRAVASNRYPRDPDVLNNGQTLVHLLDMYLKMSDDESLNQFLRQYDASLGRKPDTAPMLVRAGRPELAMRFVRGRGARVERSMGLLSAIYDKTMAERAEKFLASIEDAETRYFASVWFASLNDAKPLPEGVPPRDERMVALARQLPEVKWKSPELQQKALLMFCMSDPAKDLVGEAIESAADKIHLPSMSGNGSSEPFDEAVDLIVKRLEIAAAKGDSAPLEKFVNQTMGADTNDDWQLRYAFQRNTNKLSNLTAENIGRYGPGGYKQLAETLRRIATPSQNWHLPDLAKWNSLSLVAHLRSGQGDALREWHKAMEEPMRKKLHGNSLWPQTWEWLAATFPERTEANAAERVAAVTELLRLVDELRWLSFGEQLKMRLGTQGDPDGKLPLTKVLSDDELTAAGEKLVADAPASGATACSIAVFHQDAKRWHEASQFWEKALATLPADQAKKRTWAQLHVARTLAKDGDREAAQKAFSSIPGDRADVPFVHEYEKLKAELQNPSDAGEEDAENAAPVAEDKKEAA